MPRLAALVPTLPAILGSSALITFGIIALIEIWAARDTTVPDTARPSTRENGPWRLPPSDIVTTSSIGSGAAKDRIPGAIPDERRLVRVVYPGFAGSR